MMMVVTHGREGRQHYMHPHGQYACMGHGHRTAHSHQRPHAARVWLMRVRTLEKGATTPPPLPTLRMPTSHRLSGGVWRRTLQHLPRGGGVDASICRASRRHGIALHAAMGAWGHEAMRAWAHAVMGSRLTLSWRRTSRCHGAAPHVAMGLEYMGALSTSTSLSAMCTNREHMSMRQPARLRSGRQR